MKEILSLGIVVVLLAVVCTIGGFAFNWFQVPFQVAGPTNVQNQWQYLYDHQAALKAIALNECQAEKTLADAKINDPAHYSQRVDEVTNQIQLYHMREGEFNSDLANAFKGKLVVPSDIPRVAPTLEEAKALYCPK